MSNIQSLKNQISNKNGQAPQTGNTVKALLGSDAVKKRFEEVLKNRAPQFMASILNVVGNDDLLKKADPMSVISSCMVAASLDLPVDKNLGYFYVVPYGGTATPILGYKGYVQLALRSGQYKNINVVEVYEGELVSFNRLTEEIKIDFEQKKSEKIIGYAAYFELLNGFKKTVYWTAADIERHKQRFVKSGFGWKNDPTSMAKKTVLKNMLSKWGILSVEMQKAYADDEQAERIDITDEMNVDFGTGEILDSESILEGEIVEG